LFVLLAVSKKKPITGIGGFEKDFTHTSDIVQFFVPEEIHEILLSPDPLPFLLWISSFKFLTVKPSSGADEGPAQYLNISLSFELTLERNMVFSMLSPINPAKCLERMEELMRYKPFRTRAFPPPVELIALPTELNTTDALEFVN
jgi:hypothetical protein